MKALKNLCRAILSLLVVCCAGALPARAAEPYYQVIDLGALPGATWSFATGLNDEGQAVGWCWWAGTNETRAFVWLPEPAYGLAAGMHDLGTLDESWQWNPPYAEATAINNLGQVVGRSTYTSWDPGSGDCDHYDHAFVWLPEEAYGLSAGMHDLGTLAGDYDSEATDINATGGIVGGSGIFT
ncbi:MAG: hypothetical protein ACPMAQ_06615, partial [Phycisphaerae bacterium]